MQTDLVRGKHFLKWAYKMGNERAVDHMIQYGIIKNRKELEAEMNINDGDESTPIQQNQNLVNGVGKKTHHKMEEKSNMFISIASGWGKVSAEDL